MQARTPRSRWSRISHAIASAGAHYGHTRGGHYIIGIDCGSGSFRVQPALRAGLHTHTPQIVKINSPIPIMNRFNGHNGTRGCGERATATLDA